MVKKDLKEYIINQLENLKIEDIIVIDTSKTSSIADWVIIGSGRSGKHIESSMENLKVNMKNDKMYNGGMISGVANDGWIIYDLGNIIVHLFIPAVRDIYRLEELFNSKSKKSAINDKKKSVKKPTAKKIATSKKDKKTIVKKSSAKPVAKTTKKKVATSVKKPMVKKLAVKKTTKKTK